MINDHHGKLLLRLMVGVLMLFHGVHKLANGIDGIVGMIHEVGLPGVFAYLVYIGEVIAPLFLIVGLFSRIAALIIAANLIVAVLLAHSDDFLTLTRTGAWALELQAFYFLSAISIAIMGAGKYSLGGTNGRWN